MSVNQPILFYDGVCYLCHGLVQFILRHESSPNIMFSQLQSAYSMSYLDSSLVNNLRSVVLKKPGGMILLNSTAIVHILWLLGGKWRFVAILLWLIPLPIRHLGYVIVARYRYRLFGRSNECLLLDDATRLITDP